MHIVVAFISAPGPMEMLIIGVIAVLLFGKRLPEVGRSLGKSLVEFKKGLHSIEEELHNAAYSSSPSEGVASYSAVDDYDIPTAPKFEPPSSEPQSEPTAEPSDRLGG